MDSNGIRYRSPKNGAENRKASSPTPVVIGSSSSASIFNSTFPLSGPSSAPSVLFDSAPSFPPSSSSAAPFTFPQQQHDIQSHSSFASSASHSAQPQSPQSLASSNPSATSSPSSSHSVDQSSDSTVIWGWILLITSFLSFIGFLWAGVLAKFLPPTGIVFLDFFRDDYYYIYLIPLTLPVTFFAVYFNWLSMKFFRHN